MESRRRTLLKTISYRILGATVTGLLTWGVTGSVETGMTLGLADTLLKFGLYYAHERAWARMPIGVTIDGHALARPPGAGRLAGLFGRRARRPHPTGELAHLRD
jgi:uncharacterized membrane protein